MLLLGTGDRGSGDPLTTDLDIYRAAHLVIRKHGEDAPIQAAVRHDELLDRGDTEGAAVWKRILKAIDELLSEERPEGVEVH